MNKKILSSVMAIAVVGASFMGTTVTNVNADETTLAENDYQIAEDTLSEDVAVEDVAVEDIAVEDVAVEDIAVEDVAVEDIAIEDVAVEDIAIEDVAVLGSVQNNPSIDNFVGIGVSVDDTPKIKLSVSENAVNGLKENEEFEVIINIENVPEKYDSLALKLKYDTSCAEWISNDNDDGWSKSNEGDNILNLIYTPDKNMKKTFKVKFKALKSGTISSSGQINVSGTVVGASGGNLELVTVKYEVTTATTTTTTTTHITQPKPPTLGDSDSNGGNKNSGGNNNSGGGSNTTTTQKKETSNPTGDSGVISYLMALVAAMGVAVTTKKNQE